MLGRMLRKDLAKKKTITAALFVFIMLSSILASSGANIIVHLMRSIDHLFTASGAPHFVQLHEGTIEDFEALDAFTHEQPLVKNRQISEMLVIDNSQIYFGNSETANSSSVMDNGFVVQNPSFDMLLNLQNKKIEAGRGEIAVPIYYMQQEQLRLGDRIRIVGVSGEMELIITDFVRDVQMNPSLISSKRFVVHEEDFQALKRLTGEIETIIEFQLHNPEKLNEFAAAYQAAGLPSKGPTVDITLFKMLNALTDGIVAAVLILVSVLLILIAVLCLRFTIIASMEEDLKQIGVMKAIGLPMRDIRKVYLSKYMVLAIAASIGGYLLSLVLSQRLTSNMSLYMGVPPKHPLAWLIPASAAAAVWLVVILCCQQIFRRVNKKTAAQLLRTRVSTGGRRFIKLPLYKSRMPNVNVSLGIKEVCSRPATYLLLLFIFAVCSFMILVPVHFLNTVRSPGFVSYMGTGVSDLRIDLQQSDHLAEQFGQVQEYLAQDSDIMKFAAYATGKYSVVGSEGALESIFVETGDFTAFPLKYSSGRAPDTGSEIALSSLNADSLEKDIGDTLVLIIEGSKHRFEVSGIYQDVTNGGKTAKALLPQRIDQALWFTIQADVIDETQIQSKTEQLARLFPKAKVTGMEDYLSQTFGTTIQQIERASWLAALVAACLSVLITSLYMRLLLAKESSNIAVMKSLGFTNRHIGTQYMSRLLLVFAAGAAVGIISAGTIGEGIAGLLMSIMGASEIEFLIQPGFTYVVCPIALGILVSAATLASLRPIKQTNLANLAVE